MDWKGRTRKNCIISACDTSLSTHSWLCYVKCLLMALPLHSSQGCTFLQILFISMKTNINTLKGKPKDTTRERLGWKHRFLREKNTSIS